VGAHRRLQPDEAPGFRVQDVFHVAYRHADRELMSSQRHQLTQQQQRQQVAPGEAGWNVSKPSLPKAVGSVNGRRTNLREKDHFLKEGEDGNGKDGLAGKRQEGKRKLLELEGFRRRDLGWGGGHGDPFGAVPECPSTPRVLQIGIAMDAGMFKVRCVVVSQGKNFSGLVSAQNMSAKLCTVRNEVVIMTHGGFPGSACIR